jgi:ribonucleoside-diphosphate reductase alpha chain
MEITNAILSEITVHMKYARYLPNEQRRENWEELVTRNKEMHLKKYPDLKEHIDWAYAYVYNKEVLPSMRSMQFGGKPIEVSPNRIFNCAYAPVDDIRVFGEIMFLLLGGTGVGYSVQTNHIEKLPAINKPNPKRTRRYLIGDSIEGWADAVSILIKSYFKGTSKVRFDFSDIRPKTRVISFHLSKYMMSFVTSPTLFLLVAFVVLLLFRSFQRMIRQCFQQKQAIGGKQTPKEDEQTTR